MGGASASLIHSADVIQPGRRERHRASAAVTDVTEQAGVTAGIARDCQHSHVDDALPEQSDRVAQTLQCKRVLRI